VRGFTVNAILDLGQLRQFYSEYQISLIKGQSGATHASFRAMYGTHMGWWNPL
jgi:hypothetical protein